MKNIQQLQLAPAGLGIINAAPVDISGNPQPSGTRRVGSDLQSPQRKPQTKHKPHVFREIEKLLIFCNCAIDSVSNILLSNDFPNQEQSELYQRLCGNIASLLDVLTNDYAYITFTLCAHLRSLPLFHRLAGAGWPEEAQQRS